MKKIRIRSRIKAPSIFRKNEDFSKLKDIAKNIILLTCTAIIILTIAKVGKVPLKTELQEGDVSVNDIFAPFGFEYKWGIDPIETQNAQQQAISSVKDIYVYDNKVFKDASIKINIFFDNLIQLKNSEMPINEESYNDIKGMFNIQLSLKDIKELISYNQLPQLRQLCLSAVESVLSAPIISEEIKNKIISGSENDIVIKTELEKSIQQANVNNILTPSAAQTKLSDYINQNTDADAGVKKSIHALLSKLVKANTIFSEKDTAQARKEAKDSAEPFYVKHEIKNGEVIIFKGERATAQTIAKLSAIKTQTKDKEDVSYLIGFALILVLLFFIFIIYIKYYEPQMLKESSAIMLMCILVILVAALTKIIMLSPLPSYFIPVASASLLFTLLIGNSSVFPLVIITSTVVAMMVGNELNIFTVSLVGSIVGAFAAKKTRRRSDLLKAGLYLGVSKFVCIASFAIFNDLELIIFAREGLWGVGSGIISAGIAMICLPVLERALHLTSDIGLLELSDLNHPILKEMANKAPGTYHHSLIVGNLAESACDVISANPLLARVGAYYHDIGKIAKAEYFSENQPKVSASHDNLTPHMSSLIITNHVKDGVDIAKKYRLPKPIIEMIEQHHGTGLIYYFYQKALEKQSDENIIAEEGFRYPGPKPQSKEAAIVLLADSVEAASRTLAEPTPVHMEELVRRIVNNKFIDRQLDDCDLTLHDIDVISKSFVRILIGIYHARVEYPADARLENNKNGKH